MASVFKKQYTKPLPVGAELYVQGGERMARWKDGRGRQRKALVTDGEQGKPRLVLESRCWYGRFKNHEGVVVEKPTGCTDRANAARMVAEWEREVERVHAGIVSPEEYGILDHRDVPIATHFDDYDGAQRAAGVTVIHRTYTRRYLDRLAAECPFTTLASLRRESFERWLTVQANAGIAAKTRNIYRGAMVAFCNWAILNGRLVTNPFDKVPAANVQADRRRIRRAMTEDELTRLLAVAAERPLLEALTVRKGPRKGERYANVRPEVRVRLEAQGRERALIYKTLLLCGLRKAELTALTISNVYLDEPMPFLRLDAANEKNKSGSELVIRDDLAADLRGWLADALAALQREARERNDPVPIRLPGDRPLFDVPAGLLRIFDRDLKMAGIDKKDDRGRTLDVHALRMTLSTLMSRSGASPRTAQAAMRHSDIKLTMQTYTDPRLLDVRGALDALPALPLGANVRADDQRVVGHEGQEGHLRLAHRLALIGCKPGQPGSTPGRVYTPSRSTSRITSDDVTSSPDNGNGPLSSSDSGPNESGQEDSNLRPHGPEPSGDGKPFSINSGTLGTCNNGFPGNSRLALPLALNAPLTVETLAEAALALPMDERVRLMALIMQGSAKGPAPAKGAK